MYEVIVFGATFAAAGIAKQYKEKCLVIERKTQAGYEFFGALHFGSGYAKEIKRKEALSLRQSLLQGNAGVYGGDRYVYPYFKAAHVLFGTEIVSIQKKEDGFLCVTHGVGGYASYEAKKIVDTRTNAAISDCKTYNFLMESQEEPSFLNVHYEKTGTERHYVIHCPVPLSCGYVEARKAAWKVIKQFSETQRLILSADEFDYQVKEGYPSVENGILHLPSKAYENPVLAFEAGLCIGGGEANDISF